MRDNKLYTPDGVRDYLFDECFNKRICERKILESFIYSGYREIETPLFEYYDVFTGGIGEVRQEHAIKFFDNQGRILTLRPDITMPIARVISSKMSDEPLPLRICYLGDAFGFQTDDVRQRQFTQAGVELIGEKSAYADAEVIMLAINALKACGLTDFIIDIGQVGFFNGLAEEAGLTRSEAEQLREYVDSKDMLGVEMLTGKKGGTLADEIMRLPAMYGGEEVLESAAGIGGKSCQEALENLKEIYSILCECGYRDFISIDLGLLPSLDYYSGAIFRGITRKVGKHILTGGRYDGLCAGFGRDVPATGFAMGISRILTALEGQGVLYKRPVADVAVSAEPAARLMLAAYISSAVKRGERAVWSHAKSERELKSFAKRNGIAKTLYFKADGETAEELLGGQEDE
ncbi:MAG: ATP phosphoribosyltransferase regulatory subunit [Christensenellales bacterium]|jgi:ATP phosphoribosyltransferase regulatory subunit